MKICVSCTGPYGPYTLTLTVRIQVPAPEIRKPALVLPFVSHMQSYGSFDGF
ncbi:hypothetical protein Hdeb2414_s0003g00100451 [Helianthus debilis subsp. tardiflorus]